MGELKLENGNGCIRTSDATERVFDRDVAVADIERTLTNLSTAMLDWPSGHCYYIQGYGKHPKSTYTEIAQISGVEVIFCRSLLSPVLRFLLPFVASYEGLVKINDPRRIVEVFTKLMRLSMVGLYIFDANLENEVLDEARKSSFTRFFDLGTPRDDGYIIYMVDGDSTESKTGYVEIVHYGSSALCKAFY